MHVCFQIVGDRRKVWIRVNNRNLQLYYVCAHVIYLHRMIVQKHLGKYVQLEINHLYQHAFKKIVRPWVNGILKHYPAVVFMTTWRKEKHDWQKDKYLKEMEKKYVQKKNNQLLNIVLMETMKSDHITLKVLGYLENYWRTFNYWKIQLARVKKSSKMENNSLKQEKCYHNFQHHKNILNVYMIQVNHLVQRHLKRDPKVQRKWLKLNNIKWKWVKNKKKIRVIGITYKVDLVLILLEHLVLSIQKKHILMHLRC
eukprot:g13060.t1